MQRDEDCKATDPATDCPVCGAFKMSHQDVCDKCQKHRKTVTEHKRAAARNREFGPLY